MSPLSKGGRSFAIAAVVLLCASMLATVPVAASEKTVKTIEMFDEGTSQLELYLDKDPTRVSFTLPAKAKVLDAHMTVEGVLPPIIAKYDVGDSPMAIVGSDVDNDGDVDLAAVNFESDTVSVLLNEGHGRFDKTRPLDYMIAPEPVDLALTDLDKDGAVDLVAINQTNGNVVVRMTRTDIFGTLASYHVGGNLKKVLVGDLDNDTYPDIIVVRETYPVIAVLFSKGDGTFNPPVDVGVLASPEGAALVDIEGDGDLDVVVASTEKPYSVVVVKNNGPKKLEEAEKYGLEWAPSDIVVADFTGDGRPDLAVPSIQGNISLFTNTGVGYGMPTVLRCMKQQAMFPADINQDGRTDLISVSRWDSTVRTFLNKGGGSLVPDQLFITGSNPNDVFSADLDLDGDMDLATADSADSRVSVALNNGRGRFTWFDMYDIIEADKILYLGDLDKDGDEDLVSTNYVQQSVTVAYNKGRGVFGGASDVSVRPGYKVFVGGSGGSEPFMGAIADFDGDGDNDIMYSEELSYSIIMMFNDGNGVFREDSVAHVYGKNLLPAPPYVTLPVDVDGDKDLDIVTNHMNHDFVSILLNDGTGHFETRINHSLDGGHAYDIVPEDFDGDGDVDFVTANYGLGLDFENNITFIRNDGNGNFTNVLNLEVKKGPRSLAFADLNGDGRRDLVVSFAARKSLSEIVPGEIGVFLADTTPLKFKEAAYYRVGILPADVHLSDLNDDSKLDVMVLNMGTGAGGSISVLINNGDGSLKPQIEYPDVPYKIGDYGDLNGDSRDEVFLPVLGTHVAAYRALYYPGNLALSGPVNENIWGKAGILQMEEEANLTATLSDFLASAGKDATGNLTFTMNLTAGRCGVVRVSGLVVKYEIETGPEQGEGKTYSEQGLAITVVLVFLLIVVSLSVRPPKAPEEVDKGLKAAPSKGKGKGKKRPKDTDDEVTIEPGPVIVRTPKVEVKHSRPDWDKKKAPRPGPPKGEAPKPLPPKKPAVKVEVSKDWKPSKRSMQQRRFEDASKRREEIKKELNYKKKHD